MYSHVKKHPLFFISLIFWSVLLYFYIEIIFYVLVTFIVWILFAYLASILLFKIKVLRVIAEAIWSFPVSFAAFVLIAFIMSSLNSTTTRYKLGLDIETPTGIVSNSSIIEVYYRDKPLKKIKRFFPARVDVKGEAVYCNIENDKNIIAILSFKNDPLGTYTLLELSHIASSSVGEVKKIILPDRLQPLLVTISDTSKPNSIHIITKNDFSDYFGKGYSLKSIWVEITNEKYSSSGIQDSIPWLRIQNTGRLQPSGILRDLGVSSMYKPFIRKE